MGNQHIFLSLLLLLHYFSQNCLSLVLLFPAASWCFEPSQPQRIISGLKTNFSLSPTYSYHRSLYHKSLFLKPQLKLYPQFWKNSNTCFGTHLYSAGTKHGNLHQLSVTMSRVTYFILRSHIGTVVSHSQHRKNLEEVLEKMQVNGPGR